MMVKKGFTILEILVVLAVLGILIGIAVPRVKGIQDQGTISQVKSELNMIKTAVESYYIHQNPQAYPATTSQITANVLILETPRIASKVMYDPFGSTPTTEYIYTRSANGLYYVVGSSGISGEGTTLAINNSGVVSKDESDMICVTNGSGC